MKVIVIGLGVGMAHICALKRTGNRIIGIVDINETRLNLAKTVWENKWLHVVESVSQDEDCIYATSCEVIQFLEPDLVIIATPPDTQVSLYKKIRLYFPNSKILLEKPLIVDSVDTNTFISCEWVYNSKLINFITNETISSLGMCYPKGPEAWKINFNEVDDLLPHLQSILFKFGYIVNNVKILSKFKYKTNVSTHLVCTNKGEIELTVGRPPYYPIGTFCNGILFDWELDTFDNMYSSGDLFNAGDFLIFKQNYEKNISYW